EHNVPVRRLHDAPRDRQTETGSRPTFPLVGGRAIKRFENARDVLGSDARAPVFHADLEVLTSLLYVDADRSSRGTMLNCVVDQVAEGTGEIAFGATDLDSHKVGRNLSFDDHLAQLGESAGGVDRA